MTDTCSYMLLRIGLKVKRKLSSTYKGKILGENTSREPNILYRLDSLAQFLRAPFPENTSTILDYNTRSIICQVLSLFN